MKECRLKLLEYVQKNSYLAPDELGVILHFQARYLLTESPLTQDYIDSFIQMYGSFYSNLVDPQIAWKERIENILRKFFYKNKDGTYSNSELDEIIEISKKN